MKVTKTKVAIAIPPYLASGEDVAYVAKLHWTAFFRGSLIDFFSTEIAVTSQRLIVKMGWPSRRMTAMNLRQIESVSVEQSTLGRLLDYGTVTVAGTGGTKERLQRISHPVEFRNKLQESLQPQQTG